jgi:hypothetical protein
MLSVSKYGKDYIEHCRARVRSQVSAYEELVVRARNLVGTEQEPLNRAFGEFEPTFYNNMVLMLDSCFTHRARGQEGKDGNPVNEVRLLCASLTENGGKLVDEKGIRLKPEKSVLGYAVGDDIRLTEVDFLKLADAFFDAMEQKYS